MGRQTLRQRIAELEENNAHLRILVGNAESWQRRLERDNSKLEDETARLRKHYDTAEEWRKRWEKKYNELADINVELECQIIRLKKGGE